MKNIYAHKNDKEITKLTIDYNQYINLVHKTSELNYQDIIKLHTYLIGKKDINGICKIDLGEKYILNILNYDYGYYFNEEQSNELIKFFNSKHISNYLKQLIIKYVNNPSNKLIDIIYSEKDFNQYNGLEINTIYKSLEQLGLGELIIALSFKLNSQGSKEFLNNYIKPITLIKKIIYMSGLSTRPEYYKNSNVDKRDFNNRNLISIYNKLNIIDEEKSYNMAKMTLNLISLDPRTFIKSLYLLVASNYNHEIFLEYLDIDNHNESNIDKQLENYLETMTIKEAFISSLPKEILERISNEEIALKGNAIKKTIKKII